MNSLPSTKYKLKYDGFTLLSFIARRCLSGMHTSQRPLHVTKVQMVPQADARWQEIFTDKIGIHVYQSRNELLGTFALSRKGPTTFIMSIRPLCVPIYQRGSHWTDCREIRYLGLQENSSRHSKFCENLAKTLSTLHEHLSKFYFCRGRQIAPKVLPSSAMTFRIAEEI